MLVIIISRLLKRYLKAKRTSLFTSAATNQRGFSKWWLREAQIRFPEGQEENATNPPCGPIQRAAVGKDLTLYIGKKHGRDPDNTVAKENGVHLPSGSSNHPADDKA